VVLRRDAGRPEVVYGRRCKLDNLEHEVMVAEFEILIGERLERGVAAGKTIPDGSFTRDGERFHVEVDNSGKMTARQMADKWKRYGRVDGYILVVAQTEGRMQGLRQGATAVSEVALFSTFDRLRKAGEPWIDCAGNTVRI